MCLSTRTLNDSSHSTSVCVKNTIKPNTYSIIKGSETETRKGPCHAGRRTEKTRRQDEVDWFGNAVIVQFRAMFSFYFSLTSHGVLAEARWRRGGNGARKWRNGECRCSDLCFDLLLYK